ncbi:MAG: hypothetical protein ABL916_17645 [Burkholderiaceae bacterium]
MLRNRQLWHPTADTRANSVPSAGGAIQFIRKSATLAQIWTGGSDWNSPGNVTLAGVASGNLVLAFGGWWDSNHGTGGTQSLPSSSNGGTLSAAVNPTLPSFSPAPGWPVHGQIAYLAGANAGSHVLTPQNIGASGDGYFLAAEFSGPGSTWSLVDAGSNLALSGTSGAVDGVTVNTAGSSAQVGDLVVGLCVTDGDPSAIGVGSPTGYADNLLTTITATDNIGVGIGWKLATVAGQQSAAWAWADNDCKLGAGLIAVFRRS